MRINEEIRIREVRVTSATGEQLGIMATRDALAMAEEQHLDLVEVAPKAKPTIPQAATIEVADGATLALDYLGTNEVAFVRHAGRNYSGDINAQTCPAFITGVGALYVRPKGTVIMFR